MKFARTCGQKYSMTEKIASALQWLRCSISCASRVLNLYNRVWPAVDQTAKRRTKSEMKFFRASAVFPAP
jgi:hypothetical protein